MLASLVVGFGFSRALIRLGYGRWGFPHGLFFWDDFYLAGTLLPLAKISRTLVNLYRNHHSNHMMILVVDPYAERVLLGQ